MGTPSLRVPSQDGTEMTLVTQTQASCTAPTSSISHWTTDSTEGCFTTSRRTPPSPPPMISTWEGEGQVRAEQVCSHRTWSCQCSQLQVSESFSTLRNPVCLGVLAARVPRQASQETNSPRCSTHPDWQFLTTIWVASGPTPHLAPDLFWDPELGAEAGGWRYLPRVGVAAERQVGDHLLVGELVPLSTLDDAIQNQHVAVAFTVGRVMVGDVGPGARGEQVLGRPGRHRGPRGGPVWAVRVTRGRPAASGGWVGLGVPSADVSWE